MLLGHPETAVVLHEPRRRLMRGVGREAQRHHGKLTPSAPVIERWPVDRLHAASRASSVAPSIGPGRSARPCCDGLERTDRHPELLALLDPSGRDVERDADSPASHAATSVSSTRSPRSERFARGEAGREHDAVSAAQIAVGDRQIPLIGQGFSRRLGAHDDQLVPVETDDEIGDGTGRDDERLAIRSPAAPASR